VSLRSSNASEELILHFFSSKEVGLSTHGVPQLHMIVIGVSSHNIGCLSLWIAEPKAHIRFDMLPVLLIINVVEIVAEKDRMFLAISCSQV
jgi:hypothetical protein